MSDYSDLATVIIAFCAVITVWGFLLDLALRPVKANQDMLQREQKDIKDMLQKDKEDREKALKTLDSKTKMLDEVQKGLESMLKDTKDILETYTVPNVEK